jgi:hypothetical protein
MTTYTTQEQSAYNEGREAFRNKIDFFDSPYMVRENRRLGLLSAFSSGWTDEEAGRVAEEAVGVISEYVEEL